MLALGFGLTSIVAEKLEVDNHQLLSCFGWSLNSRQCSKFICLYLSLDRGAIRQAAANTFQLQIDEQQFDYVIALNILESLQSSN